MHDTVQAATKTPGQERVVKVWDAPVRLFHWSIVLLVAFSYVTARQGWIEWHFLSGYTILALVGFRIAWGIVGSDTARFSAFVRGPRAALQHLSHVVRGKTEDEPGHNAAGGLMVLVLLGLLLFQAGTGLFSGDGIFVEGPLAQFVGGAMSETITGWHGFGFDLILIAVALHVAAVVFYAVVLKQNLVRPMITGRKWLASTVAAPHMGSLWVAAALLAISAGAVWLLATQV